MAYLAGYVVLKIEKRLSCSPCANALHHSDTDPLSPHIVSALKLRTRSLGKSVTFASQSMFKVIVVADRIFEKEIEWGNKLPNTKNLFLYLSMKVMRIIDVRNLFPSLHQHALDTTPVNAEIHTVSLVKLLVFRFFKVRCLSYLKLLNSKNTEETSIRNSILKQIQFKGL